MQTPVVICGFKRSPMHFANKGALAKVRPDDMAAEVVKALVADTGVNADDIEDLLMGCAFPEAEQGFNLAKIVVQHADLPVSIAGATVNRFLRIIDDGDPYCRRLYSNGRRGCVYRRRCREHEPHSDGRI